MARRRAHYTFADLVEGFRLMKGSGIAEQELAKRGMEQQVRQFLDAQRANQSRRRPHRPRFDPNLIDHKRRQANDID